MYGSFLIGVAVIDSATGTKFLDVHADRLSALPKQAITNRYVAKVQSGAHSLVVPLGAKARITIPTGAARLDSDHRYTMVLTDISGATWMTAVEIPD